MSGSRGPLSSPNPVRRNLKPAGIQLPLNGYDGPIPEWPLIERTDIELYRWEQLWRTAQAAMWVRMHIDLVVARYVRLALAVESETKNNVATAQTLNTVTALEDRLGLNPQALKRLEWEIVADEVEEQRDKQPASRRLKAVDPEAS